MKKIIILVILIAVLISLFAFVSAYRWNDGICRKCGEGHYDFTNGARGKTANYYYYKCDNCGHVIMTYWAMD